MYLQEHNLFTNNQFGRSKLSTSVALAKFTEEVLDNLDDKLITGAIFIDLRKAFDTVDHVLLLSKLENHLGCSTSVLS